MISVAYFLTYEIKFFIWPVSEWYYIYYKSHRHLGMDLA